MPPFCCVAFGRELSCRLRDTWTSWVVTRLLLSHVSVILCMHGSNGTHQHFVHQHNQMPDLERADLHDSRSLVSPQSSLPNGGDGWWLRHKAAAAPAVTRKTPATGVWARIPSTWKFCRAQLYRVWHGSLHGYINSHTLPFQPGHREITTSSTPPSWRSCPSTFSLNATQTPAPRVVFVCLFAQTIKKDK